MRVLLATGGGNPYLEIMMDQTSEVQPVVTDADVGEQGNVPGTSSTDTTMSAIVPTVPDVGSSSSAGLVTTNSGEVAISTDELLSSIHASMQVDAGMKARAVIRLAAAIDDLEAKIVNGAHVFAHEVAELRGYVKAIV